MSEYPYRPPLTEDEAREQSRCWLCGANENRVCWCHEGDEVPPGYNGICRCPE